MVMTPPLLDSYARLCWRSFQETDLRGAKVRPGGEVLDANDFEIAVIARYRKHRATQKTI